jgi:hypothetical protein
MADRAEPAGKIAGEAAHVGALAGLHLEARMIGIRPVDEDEPTERLRVAVPPPPPPGRRPPGTASPQGPRAP